jgi:hypothetical protein
VRLAMILNPPFCFSLGLLRWYWVIKKPVYICGMRDGPNKFHVAVTIGKLNGPVNPIKNSIDRKPGFSKITLCA